MNAHTDGRSAHRILALTEAAALTSMSYQVDRRDGSLMPLRRAASARTAAIGGAASRKCVSPVSMATVR